MATVIALAPAMDDAATFIKALTGDSDTPCTWQTFDDVKDRRDLSLLRVLHGPLSAVAPKLLELNNRGAGIFVTVNRTDLRGRCSENVTELRALFVDSDNGGLPILPVPPSILVQSARGQHAYWLLRPGEELHRFEQAQKHLAQALGTDPKVFDLPRVMRVPGFFHQKGEVFRTSLIEAVPERVYSVEEVVAPLPAFRPRTETEWAPPARPVDRSTALDQFRRYLERVPGAVEGESGDAHTYRVACLAVVDFDLTDLEAEVALGEWNSKCSPPWSAKELEEKVRHARKYARGVRGSKLREQSSSVVPASSPVRDEPRAEKKPRRLRFMSAAEYVDAWNNLPEVVTVPTGISSLDKALGGGLPACQVSQIVGGPGARKSELVRHIRNHVAAAGHHVLHVDAELTIGLLGTRDIAQRAKMASAIVRDRKSWDAYQSETVDAAQKRIEELKTLWVLCTAPSPLHELAEAVQEVIEATKDSPLPRLIILDSLQQLSFGVEAKERRHEVERFIAWANDLAKTTGSAVLITSERKRGNSEDGVLHSGAESRSVEYQSAVVLVLEPEGSAEDEIAGAARSEWEQRVRMIVAKNREGQKGKLPDVLVFKGPFWGFQVETAEDELAETVLSQLADGPKGSAEIASALKKRRHAVDAVLQWLVDQGLAERLRLSGKAHKVVYRDARRSSDERRAFSRVPGYGTSQDER
jgi:KaiC/GvpD/RAD55 family RecA-like ATPase